MSQVRPYYLLGKQHISKLEERVQPVLESVVARWWLGGDIIQASSINNFYDCKDLENNAVRYFAQRKDFSLALLGTEQLWLELAEVWLGCRAAIASPLVQTLTAAFCKDVFCALAEDSRGPELRSNLQWSQLPSSMLHSGSGSLVIEIIIRGTSIRLLASASFWPFLADAPPVRTQKKLTSCATALGNCQVHIGASLPVAQLPLTDIVALAVGDFLNLGHDLSGRVRLQGNDIDLSLAGTIGCKQARKAIKLTALQNEKSA